MMLTHDDMEMIKRELLPEIIKGATAGVIDYIVQAGDALEPQQDSEDLAEDEDSEYDLPDLGPGPEDETTDAMAHYPHHAAPEMGAADESESAPSESEKDQDQKDEDEDEDEMAPPVPVGKDKHSANGAAPSGTNGFVPGGLNVPKKPRGARRYGRDGGTGAIDPLTLARFQRLVRDHERFVADQRRTNAEQNRLNAKILRQLEQMVSREQELIRNSRVKERRLDLEALKTEGYRFNEEKLLRFAREASEEAWQAELEDIIQYADRVPLGQETVARYARFRPDPADSTSPVPDRPLTKEERQALWQFQRQHPELNGEQALERFFRERQPT